MCVYEKERLFSYMGIIRHFALDILCEYQPWLQEDIQRETVGFSSFMHPFQSTQALFCLKRCIWEGLRRWTCHGHPGIIIRKRPCGLLCFPKGRCSMNNSGISKDVWQVPALNVHKGDQNRFKQTRSVPRAFKSILWPFFEFLLWIQSTI